MVFKLSLDAKTADGDNVNNLGNTTVTCPAETGETTTCSWWLNNNGAIKAIDKTFIEAE